MLPNWPLTAFHSSLFLKIAEQLITLLLSDDNVVLLLTNLLQADLITEDMSMGEAITLLGDDDDPWSVMAVLW